MIEIKINTQELINQIKNDAQKIIKNDLNEYNIWDNDEITEEVDNFFKELTKEILNKNKEEYKKMIEKQIKNCLDDIISEIVSNTIG